MKGCKKGYAIEERLNTIDAETLLCQPMKQTAFLVNGLLAPGLYILAGAPKVGKSWLALWLCVQTAVGKPVWKFATRKCTALYLCLEDNRQRIQNRLVEMVGDQAENFSSLHFSTEAKRLAASEKGVETGLLRQFHEFVSEHPDTRLIVIDTLQKVRSNTDINYSADYSDLSLLKRFADQHALTILVIHHLRKMKDDDPLNRISGTTGISGADSLQAVREQSGSSLYRS